MADIPNLDVGILDKVTIATSTYQQPTYAKACLDSILKYTTYPNYEVVVNDDASGVPALTEYLTGLASNNKIKLILNSVRRKVDNSMAAVKSLATGQFVCWINDDCEIPEECGDWLTVLVNTLKANRGKWASVTPAMYHSKENKTVYWVGKIKDHIGKPHHDFIHAPFGDPRIPTFPVECCYNCFACCLMWKGILDVVPLGLRRKYYGVDSHWCFQTEREYGLQHWMVPQTYIYHKNIWQLRKGK